jgi:hypothetical protein
MRPKVLLPVIASSAILLALLYLFPPGMHRPADAAPAPADAAEKADSQTPDAPVDKASPPVNAPVRATIPGQNALDSNPVDAARTAQQHEARVNERIAQLQDLAMNNDPGSLNTILSALGDPDAPVRKAAVEAAIQFGSQDAIPALQDAAAQTEDPQEKIDLLKAVEFLKIPPID